jgi:Flp pilus assembly protein TadG
MRAQHRADQRAQGRRARGPRVASRRLRRRGTEILEAALVLPLLLVLAFGTVEFGYFFYLEHNFQAAAREGVRAAIPNGGDEDLIVPAVDEVMERAGIDNNAYETTWEEIDLDGDRYLKVTVEADWRDVGVETGLFMRFDRGGQTELVHGNARIRGTATMRIEQ